MVVIAYNNCSINIVVSVGVVISIHKCIISYIDWNDSTNIIVTSLIDYGCNNR